MITTTTTLPSRLCHSIASWYRRKYVAAFDATIVLALRTRPPPEHTLRVRHHLAYLRPGISQELLLVCLNDGGETTSVRRVQSGSGEQSEDELRPGRVAGDVDKKRIGRAAHVGV